jgi:hypothetical protein
MRNFAIKYLIICLTICLTSCEAQTFTIKKGSHYPSPNPYSWHSGVTELERSVVFDSSCIYNLGTVDDSDINKLFGWGVGFTSSSSLRIGWNCKSGYAIDLFAYIHYKGKRWTIPKDSIIQGSGQLIGKGFQTNKPIQCSIERTDKELIFVCVQGMKYGIMRLKFTGFPKGSGWYQNPYFGGTSVAPHQMTIKIE